MQNRSPGYWLKRISTLAERARRARTDQELAAIIEEYEGVAQTIKDQLGTDALDESLGMIAESKPELKRRLC